MVIKQPNSAEGGCTRGELSIPIPVLKYIWYLAYNRELSGRATRENNNEQPHVHTVVPVERATLEVLV